MHLINTNDAQGIGAGDCESAKKALRSMQRVSSGIPSDDESEADDDILQLGRAGQISIVRCGRKFAVRKTTKGQIIDVGRWIKYNNVF